MRQLCDLGQHACALRVLVPLPLKEGWDHREFDIPKASLVGLFLYGSMFCFPALCLFLLISAYDLNFSAFSTVCFFSRVETFCQCSPAFFLLLGVLLIGTH